MAIHTIMLPDMTKGREPRSIVWDDEAGTVEGDHFDVRYLKRVLAAPKPVTVGAGHIWHLRDPGHDPSEFYLLLCLAYWPIEKEPLRSTLPPVFDGVEAPEGEPGEELYDEHGNLMT